MSSINERQNLIYGDGPLTRAALIFPDPLNTDESITITVQFNPTEYTISRGSDSKDTTGNGENSNPENLQVSKGELATLSVSLILDTSTYMADYKAGEGLHKYLNDDKELSQICHDIAYLMKLAPDSHTQNCITFKWGAMEFTGILKSLSMNYQMFNRSGYPVRVKMDMSILGEEEGLLNTMESSPRQSPDRTKIRRMSPREELWMLADAEYGDASCWKEIAQENGILNPRKVDHTRRLKVPAL